MPSRNEETSGGLWAAANKPRAKLRKLKRKLGKNYGHLTRQIKLRASPASLIVANALIGEDRYVLSRTQRAKLLDSGGPRPGHLDLHQCSREHASRIWSHP